MIALGAITATANAQMVLGIQTEPTVLEWNGSSETITEELNYTEWNFQKETETEVYRLYFFNSKGDRKGYTVLFKKTGKTQTCVVMDIYSEIKLTVGGIPDPYNVRVLQSQRQGDKLNFIYEVPDGKMVLTYDTKKHEWTL